MPHTEVGSPTLRKQSCTLPALPNTGTWSTLSKTDQILRISDDLLQTDLHGVNLHVLLTFYKRQPCGRDSRLFYTSRVAISPHILLSWQ